MRSALLVLGVLLAGGVLWWLCSGDDIAPPTNPSTGSSNANVARPEDPTPASGGDVRREGPTTPIAKSTDPTGDPTASTPSTPNAAPANVVLQVRDLAARTPVAAFRWRWQNSLTTLRGKGTAGRAELTLPEHAVGQLLVEADGLQPWLRDGIGAPPAPSPTTVLDVFLAPAVAAAGITLHVRDLALAPIANVRVDAFRIHDDNRQLAWQLGNAMWARRAMAADGRYPLSTLAPGEYGIRVVATDADGELLPLLPYVHTFVLTGDNGFIEDVPLEAGALLALDLRDAAGQPFDPVRHGVATLSLRLPGGPAVQRKWIVRQHGVEAGTIDVVPGVGLVMLAEAIAGGQYNLEVFVGGQPRVNKPVFLRPGQKHEERVDVP